MFSIKKYRAERRANREEQARQERLAQHRMWWEVCNAVKGGEPIPFEEETFG
jgi:hypothetical protein